MTMQSVRKAYSAKDGGTGCGGCAAQERYGAAAFFSEEHFAHLQGLMYPKKAEAGSHLFWEGDQAGKLYFVRSGCVKLTKTTEEGRTFILSMLRPGDLFGELTNDGEGVYTFSAEVTENAEIGVIQETDLETLLFRHGDFAVAFAKWMAMQHRTTQSKFRDLLMFGKPGALASTLIRLGNTCGKATQDGIYLTMKFTNTELAEFIGSTRESVNRMLSELKADGIIDNQAGHLVIKSLKELKSICQCPTFPACSKDICRI